MSGPQANPSEDKMTWIPVEQMLPKYAKRVLIKCAWGSCKPSARIGFRKSTDKNGEHWSFDGEEIPRESWSVLAWMPFPEDCCND